MVIKVVLVLTKSVIVAIFKYQAAFTRGVEENSYNGNISCVTTIAVLIK